MITVIHTTASAPAPRPVDIRPAVREEGGSHADTVLFALGLIAGCGVAVPEMAPLPALSALPVLPAGQMRRREWTAEEVLRREF